MRWYTGDDSIERFGSLPYECVSENMVKVIVTALWRWQYDVHRCTAQIYVMPPFQPLDSEELSQVKYKIEQCRNWTTEKFCDDHSYLSEIYTSGFERYKI